MKNPVFFVLLTSVFMSPALIAQAAEQQPQKQQSASPSAAQKADENAAGAAANSGGKFITEESGQQILSSNLVGMSVTNSNKDDIGKIDNLVLDKDGRLTGVVVSVGGFLGIGSKHVALPMSEVQINPGQKAAVVNLTKDDLKNAPSFKTKEEQKKEAEQAAHKAAPQQKAPATPPGMPPKAATPSGAAPAAPAAPPSGAAK